MKDFCQKLSQLARFAFHALFLLFFFIVISIDSAYSQWSLQTVNSTANFNEVYFYDSNVGMAVSSTDLAKTTDGGTTWAVQTAPFLFTDVHIIGPQTVIAVGLDGGNNAAVHRSTDFGNTWASTTLSTSNILTAVDFDNNLLGLAVGLNGIAFRTTDGGLTWNSVSTGTSDGITDVSLSGNGAYICTYQGTVRRSTDGGQTWLNGMTNANRNFESVDFFAPDSGTVAGYSQFGNLYMTTTNGGTVWSGSGFSTTTNITDIHHNSYDIAFAINRDQYVWRTFNYGNWIPESIPGLTQFDTLLAVHFANSNDGWAVGKGGIIAHTSNGGNCTPFPHVSRPNVCLGDTMALVSSTGWTNYIWTDSATSNVLSNSAFHVFYPTNDMTFYFQATNAACGTFYDTLRVNVLNCDSVWPGDANADGIANMYDLLNIGFGAGSMGPVRAGATINWTAQFATDWGPTFGLVVDYKHADCNGNGLIDANDTLALSQNYSLTHNKTNATTGSSGAPFYLQPMFDSLMVGDTGYVRIMLGDVNNPIQNLHGIAFTFTYDNTLIDTNTVVIDFDTTWIAPTNMAAVGMVKDFYFQGRTDAGYTHINQLNSNGYGQIGGITFVTIDNISGKKDILTKMLNLGLTGVLALDDAFEPIAISPQVDSVIVYDLENSLIQPKPKAETRIYPNPSTGMVYIDAGNSAVSSIRIVDAQGRKIKEYNRAGALDLSALPNGMYFITVRTETGSSSHKLNIIR